MDWSRGRASLAGNGAMRCAYCALRTHHADPRIHPFAKRIVGWAKARHSNPAAWAKSRARRANAARTRKAILPTLLATSLVGNGAMRCAYCALRNRALRQFPPSHSGARAQRGSPESITTVRDHGFRARAFGAPRNDGASRPVQTPNSWRRRWLRARPGDSRRRARSRGCAAGSGRSRSFAAACARRCADNAYRAGAAIPTLP